MCSSGWARACVGLRPACSSRSPTPSHLLGAHAARASTLPPAVLWLLLMSGSISKWANLSDGGMRALAAVQLTLVSLVVRRAGLRCLLPRRLLAQRERPGPPACAPTAVPHSRVLVPEPAQGCALLSGVAYSGVQLLQRRKQPLKRRNSLDAVADAASKPPKPAPGAPAPLATIRVNAGLPLLEDEGGSPFADDTPYARWGCCAALARLRWRSACSATRCPSSTAALLKPPPPNTLFRRSVMSGGAFSDSAPDASTEAAAATAETGQPATSGSLWGWGQGLLRSSLGGLRRRTNSQQG